MRISLALLLLWLTFASSPGWAQDPGGWPEVKPANANLYLGCTDLALPWAGPPLELKRSYNSRSAKLAPPPAARKPKRRKPSPVPVPVSAPPVGSLGPGWTLGYSRHVLGLTGPTVFVVEDSGS